MNYGLSSAKFQNLDAKTLRLTARASDLGVVTATTITISLKDIALIPIEATDVLVCNNLTDATVAVPTIVSGNLVLTDTAIAATDLFDVVIRLK